MRSDVTRANSVGSAYVRAKDYEANWSECLQECEINIKYMQDYLMSEKYCMKINN